MEKKKQELKSHKEKSEQLLIQFTRTVDKFFPNFNKLLQSLSEPRNGNKCDYRLEDLLWLSLLLLITSSNSRNNYNHELRYQESIELLNNLFGLNLVSIPHGDTLAYLWERLSYHELEKLRHAMVITLIKGRYLEKFRFRKTYLVAPQFFDKKKRRYRWINELEYQGRDFNGKVNLLAIASEDDKGIYQTRRAFITNHEITKKSAIKIESGQLRWKIENQGFDIQKHHGYNLEHTYSKHPNAMKVINLLIQMVTKRQSKYCSYYLSVIY